MSESQSDILTLWESFRKADLLGKSALCLSFWFGAGLMPGAPGTFGTLAALPLAVLTKHLGVFYEVLALIILVPVAVWSSGLSQRLLGRDDPREVVIDEVAGFLLAILLLPASLFTWSLGFILFRFFDILKPFPMGMSEKKIKGGAGIVLDDLMAGVYANLGMKVLLLFFRV